MAKSTFAVRNFASQCESRGRVAGCWLHSVIVHFEHLFSRVSAALACVAVLPVFTVIALAIFIDDGMPILFRQWRVGREGCDFRILKFRTMTNCPLAEAGSFELGSSRRVTRVGRILRATKLDELPQLLNVARGEMAWVGPRPEVRKWVKEFPEHWAEVHKLKPGITDPAAIAFRDEEELLKASNDPEELYRSEILPQKLEIYIKYAECRSFWTDLKVVGQTIIAVLFRSRP